MHARAIRSLAYVFCLPPAKKCSAFPPWMFQFKHEIVLTQVTYLKREFTLNFDLSVYIFVLIILKKILNHFPFLVTTDLYFQVGPARGQDSRIFVIVAYFNFVYKDETLAIYIYERLKHLTFKQIYTPIITVWRYFNKLAK
jgi:hypothetical protein